MKITNVKQVKKIEYFEVVEMLREYIMQEYGDRIEVDADADDIMFELENILDEMAIEESLLQDILDNL